MYAACSRSAVDVFDRAILFLCLMARAGGVHKY